MKRGRHSRRAGSNPRQSTARALKIERQDSDLMAGNQESVVVTRTVSTLNNGQRKAVVRRIRIADQAGESHMLLNIIEDRTDQANIAGVAA
jgi:hypothetical protein